MSDTDPIEDIPESRSPSYDWRLGKIPNLLENSRLGNQTSEDMSVLFLPNSRNIPPGYVKIIKERTLLETEARHRMLAKSESKTKASKRFREN